MNKRLLISIIILLTAVIALSAASPAFVDREVQRSDSLINAGNYAEAVRNLDRLEKKIDRKDIRSLSKILNTRSEAFLQIGNAPAMLKTSEFLSKPTNLPIYGISTPRHICGWLNSIVNTNGLF